MSPMLRMLALFRRAHPLAFAGGLALMLVTLAAGALLLGLSGWFITACAAAGAAGVGVGFDFFRPSAAVRFLALGRAAARWGERVVTHDATLRFLADVRLRLFAGLAARPWAALGRLRRAVALHRLTADVDALDGLYLRLAAPPVALAATLALALPMLGWLVDWGVALAVTGLIAAGGIGALGAGLLSGRRDAVRRALAGEALRVRLVDLALGVTDLAVAGRLDEQRAAIRRADAAAQAAAARLDRLDRGIGAGLTVTGAAAAGAALALGAAAGLAAETVAIGVFAALALAEGAAPLRRAGLDAGRMRLAARRLAPALAAEPLPMPADAAGDGRLDFEAAGFAHPGRAPVLAGLTLAVAPGEWVALTGPSGGGKSTALMLAAGMLAPSTGRVLLGGVAVTEWPETALRARLALLPQRSELLLGTVADNLRLAAPQAPDAALWAALATVELDAVVRARGGLGAVLGEGGLGLSGGEARRLALARLLLRETPGVLLDEPTEGLDADTAARVIGRLRLRLRSAAVLTASHRAAEIAAADRVVRVG
jgi:ATP-binding cassette subfamily C protein CydC